MSIIKNKEPLFSASNLLSVSRIPLSIAIAWTLHVNGGNLTPLVWGMIFYGVLSDFLDGFMARKFNQVTELGKILDPISDKIGAFIFFSFTVIILEWIPLWYLYLIVARDALILMGSIYIRQKKGSVAMSIMSGKISVNAMAAYWISELVTSGVNYWPQDVLLWLSVTLMIYSFGDYTFRFYRQCMENDTPSTPQTTG